LSTNTLGRYHIIREIARSNDIVYEAMDPAQGKKIALKELQMPPTLVGQARRERIERFTREARAAARLRHRSIVHIVDYGQAQDRYYIAMEFLEGQSLRDLLRQRTVLPVQEAFRITIAVAEALDYAHKNGVVHRDIKPDNVHLEPDGRVVITDFGIARLTFEPSLTADGQIFGTPSYMSPEQVTGKGIDRRSDIFSLGVMLYEMVTGRKPFVGDSVITITYNIMNMEAPPLPGGPPGLDAVIRRAMAKDPGRRYQSIGEMAEDLRQLTQGRPPRHASMSPPAASVGVGRAPSGPGPLPPTGPFPGSAPGRPPVPSVPLPRMGPAPPATGYPPPGARQLSAPVASVPASMQARGAVPLPQPILGPNGRPTFAPSAPSPAGRPAPPLWTPSRRETSNGWDFTWFVGWLGVAVIIGVIVMVLVWAAVTAFNRFQQDSTARSTHHVQTAADQALGEGKYQQALDGYLQVVRNSTGERQRVARRAAAVAAVALARTHIDNGKPEKGEPLCRQALELNPDSAGACVQLGRALSAQGKVDEAVNAFDEARPAAKRAEASRVSPQEIAAAKEAADAAPLWKANALYEDGVAHLQKDPALARQRFEATIQAAPRSDFARNARNQLALLNLDSPGAASTPSPAGGPAPGGDSAPVEQPEGWQRDYDLHGNG
jgi:predicted negative regulator of RcsB-dependent stress response